MRKTLLLTIIVASLVALAARAEDGVAIPRMPNGKPDLSGTYDTGTVTPVDRPAQYGDKLYLTPEEAKKLEESTAAFWKAADRKNDSADREAPPKGGDGNNQFGAGGVGGYNAFWIDPGSKAVMVDGKFRTSIIDDPPNGRRPPMTKEGQARVADNFSSFIHNNTGTASWLEHDGPGPFDNPEDLALNERCLLSFSSGSPKLPSIYNNYVRVVQSDDHLVILLEMVHDARIVRIDSEHGPASMKRWLGDSVGHWEGDTLVVDTLNYRDENGLFGADQNLHVVERFSRAPDGNLRYAFRVEDPTAWTAPWAGEYEWQASDNRVYEYACHEGNYALGNILRGARLLEEEWVKNHSSR